MYNYAKENESQMRIGFPLFFLKKEKEKEGNSDESVYFPRDRKFYPGHSWELESMLYRLLHFSGMASICTST